MISKFKYQICLVFALLIFANCTKHDLSHPVVGTYTNEKHYEYYDNTGINVVTTENVLFDIKSSQDSLNVLGAKIHEKDFEFGKTYTFSSGFNYIQFKFKPDSIYVTLHYGSSGSNSTTKYRGRKLQ